MSTTQPSRKIVLLGDLALHTMVERDTDPDDSNTQPYRGYRRSTSNPLLPAMIGEALLDGLVDSTTGLVVPDYKSVCASADSLEASCGELISILDLFPEGSASRRDQRDKLRVRSEYLVGPVHSDSAPPKPPHQRLNALLKKIDLSKLGDGHLLVLYDHGGLLRKGLKPPDGAHASSETLDSLGALAGGAACIVIGVNGDLRNLAWLDALRPALPDAQRRRTVVLLTADSLRKAGLKIARYGPLEDTVKDIFESREHPPLQSLFKLADHLVVVFAETGGLYIDHSQGRWKGSLHFCPNFDRYAQADSATYGFMPGKFSIFLVSLVKALYGAAKDGRDDLDLGSAIRLGTVAYNRHFNEGLARGRKEGFSPYAAFEEAVSKDTCADLKNKLEEAVRNPKKRSLLVSSLKFDEVELRAGWSRTWSLLAQPGLRGRLHDIVERGLDAVLVETKETWAERLEKQEGKPWFPQPYITVPYSALGKLRLLDRKEIADHYSLAKVIRKYLETKKWDTPLSIAVFGNPGSGKSFGVQQILDTVDPGRKSKPLTFNLAQFNTVDQLTEAFHQIQDRALSSDEVPLAIFDEFDASFGDERLGWLKYFLAPMQDGRFRGSTGDYKVGRAIFLFAGGTSSSFAKFCVPLDLKANAKDPDVQGLTERDVRGFKLADFASRLRGHLDVADLSDSSYDSARGVSAPIQLRRAVILRSLLEKLAEPILVSSHEDDFKQARIHPKVIEAFLDQPNYLHGVRSMEAIIQMSRWIDDEFVPASLPSEDLLKAHVAREFLPPIR